MLGIRAAKIVIWVVHLHMDLYCNQFVFGTFILRSNDQLMNEYMWALCLMRKVLIK